MATNLTTTHHITAGQLHAGDTVLTATGRAAYTVRAVRPDRGDDTITIWTTRDDQDHGWPDHFDTPTHADVDVTHPSRQEQS